MCFSAPVSFGAAAVTGLTGAYSLKLAPRWRDMPLASIPLIFAAQQFLEGLVWLQLADTPALRLHGPLVDAYAFCALVLWPLWPPLALALVEPGRLRQAAMAALFLLAVPLAIAGFQSLTTYPVGVCAIGDSLSYANGKLYPLPQYAAYIACACLPMLLSSHEKLRLFGIAVVTGLAVSALFYFVASFSAWCFFAALGSTVILTHFALPRKTQLQFL